MAHVLLGLVMDLKYSFDFIWVTSVNYVVTDRIFGYHCCS